VVFFAAAFLAVAMGAISWCRVNGEG